MRERETKAGGEEARSKVWLKTGERKKIEALASEEKTPEESKLKTSVRSLTWNKSSLTER